MNEFVERLIADRPVFHTADTDGSWTANPSTLRMIARHLSPGHRTVEVGCGASTVVFLAMGADHTAISPNPAEHARIRAYCERIGLDHSAATFVEGRSDQVLPTLAPEQSVDAAFIDGDHSFPYPIVDWHYMNMYLRAGGLLVADDIRAAAVGVIVRNMLENPNWEMLEVADRDAAAFRKLGHQLTFEHFLQDPFNRAPDYSFLGPAGARRQRALDRIGQVKQSIADRLRPARDRADRGPRP
jgi:predicted O-methyltransferase YrrM